MFEMMIQQERITSQFSLKLAGAPWNCPVHNQVIAGVPAVTAGDFSGEGGKCAVVDGPAFRQAFAKAAVIGPPEHSFRIFPVGEDVFAVNASGYLRHLQEQVAAGCAYKDCNDCYNTYLFHIPVRLEVNVNANVGGAGERGCG